MLKVDIGQMHLSRIVNDTLRFCTTLLLCLDLVIPHRVGLFLKSFERLHFRLASVIVRSARSPELISLTARSTGDSEITFEGDADGLPRQRDDSGLRAMAGEVWVCGLLRI